jgi:UDP-N-acetyl-2-amino-2-deoxyglucuronate dehydrogenase
MPPGRIRVALVGAGTIAPLHLRAYRSMAEAVDVVALVESDPVRREAASRVHAIPAFSELAGALEGDVDLIDVCVPPIGHEDLVIAALEAGRSVVCEKPLAPTLGGLDRIEKVAGNHPGRLATVHQYRTMPEVREMVRLRDSGKLGDLLFGHFAHYDRLAGGPVGQKSWWGEWEMGGGGVGMTQFIHQLDLMCFVFGRPVEVAATMATLSAPIESEDTLSATVRFEGGAIVGGSATVAAQRLAFRIDVIGSRGSVHYPWALHLPDRANRTSDGVARLRSWAGTDSSLPAKALRKARRTIGLGEFVESKHTTFLRSLIQAMRAGRPLPVPPDEARRPVELCTARP